MTPAEPTSRRSKIITTVIVVIAILMTISLFASPSHAQITHCPPPSEPTCYGGLYFTLKDNNEVQIFFDTSVAYNIEICTAVFEKNTYSVPVNLIKIKERKHEYKVVMTLEHPKFNQYEFTFIMPKQY